MAHRQSRRQNLNLSVKSIVIAAIVFLVLVSVQEKFGVDLGLPNPFKPDLIQTALGGDILPDETSADMENSPLKVHFIDVGQGKSILIQAPEKTVLIDAGENNQGQKVLRYLEAHKIDKIDIAVGTHPHSDHIGGMDVVINGIPVDTVILPVIPDDIVPTTPTYTDMLTAIADANLKITPAKPGNEYNLGGGITLGILGPVADYSDLNDMSIVSRLDYDDVSFLFTGDMTALAERDLLEDGVDLKVTVLDVGHHGSHTSSSAKFLREVNPRTAVISCGVDNSYGHPHREVMQRLQEHDMKILRTDLDGTVIITSDGKTLGVETEK